MPVVALAKIRLTVAAVEARARRMTLAHRAKGLQGFTAAYRSLARPRLGGR